MGSIYISTCINRSLAEALSLRKFAKICSVIKKIVPYGDQIILKKIDRETGLAAAVVVVVVAVLTERRWRSSRRRRRGC